MTDVAYTCLSKRKREVEFSKLWTEVSKQMKIPEERLKRKKSQFYSELMLDNRFASLENNKWDLRNRRKFDELHTNKEDIEMDEDNSDVQLDRSGLDLPTGEDAFDN
jgi:DNA-directed RNA polymerase subunit delta